MSKDCERSKGIQKEPLPSEKLCKTFVKFAVKDLVEIWHEKDRIHRNLSEQATNSTSGWSQGDTGDVKTERSYWEINTTEKPEWIWLQGYAISISENKDTFEISDHPGSTSHTLSPTSSVIIVNCLNAPGGITLSSKGKYFQVVYPGTNHVPVIILQCWLLEVTTKVPLGQKYSSMNIQTPLGAGYALMHSMPFQI